MKAATPGIDSLDALLPDSVFLQAGGSRPPDEIGKALANLREFNPPPAK